MISGSNPSSVVTEISPPLFVICVLVTSTRSMLKADCNVTGPRIPIETESASLAIFRFNGNLARDLELCQFAAFALENFLSDEVPD
jgi:hypothetical protein